jgi:hypothetical protein
MDGLQAKIRKSVYSCISDLTFSGKSACVSEEKARAVLIDVGIKMQQTTKFS